MAAMGYMSGKYTESKDKKKDAKMLKKAGLDKDEKEKFEKADKAHGKKKKPKTMAEDKKIDAKIISKIKKSDKDDKKEKKEKKKK
jgi:hypothetical protein